MTSWSLNTPALPFFTNPSRYSIYSLNHTNAVIAPTRLLILQSCQGVDLLDPVAFSLFELRQLISPSGKVWRARKGRAGRRPVCTLTNTRVGVMDLPASRWKGCGGFSVCFNMSEGCWKRGKNKKQWRKDFFKIIIIVYLGWEHNFNSA